MHHYTQDFLERLKSTCSNEQAFAVFAEAMSERGFDQVLYALLHTDQEQQILDALILDSFDPEWMKFYLEHNLIQQDPIAWHVANRSDPVFFSDAYKKIDDLPGSSPFKKGADISRDWGVKNAISSAIEMRNGISATFTLQMPKEFTEREARLHLKAHFKEARALIDVFHSYFDQQKFAMDRFGLTPRELEVLKWLADGLMAKQIASKMNTSVFTVQKQIYSAKQRLHALTTTQAVAKSIIWGLIF